MDLVAPTNQAQEGFYSFQQLLNDNRSKQRNFGCRVRAGFSIDYSSMEMFVGRRASFVDGVDCRKPQGFAISEAKPFGSGSEIRTCEMIPHGYSGNGLVSSSSVNYDELEVNNRLRLVVKNGELEKGFEYLENMICDGYMPDITSCTSLIRALCQIGKTKKATRVMEILEDSGTLPDVITYNVLIRGYCKAGEMDNVTLLLATSIIE